MGFRHGDGVFPAVIGGLVHAFGLVFPANIQINVLLEILDGDGRVIVADPDFLGSVVGHGGNVVDAFSEQIHHIGR